jgi:uncharacterized protein
VDPSHRDGSGQAGHQVISPDTGQMEDAVRTASEGLRLRIFVHEALRHARKPLYVAIVELARREGLAGATVFRGIEGYGLHRHLHTARLVDLSDDLPMIVEIVDTSEAIRRFLPLLDRMIPHGTATLSPVHIVKYSTRQQA